MAKKNFYVVWKGARTGVFSSWNDCKEQIQGCYRPLYQKFQNEESAQDAYKMGYEAYQKWKQESSKDWLEAQPLF